MTKEIKNERGLEYTVGRAGTKVIKITPSILHIAPVLYCTEDKQCINEIKLSENE